MNLEELQDRPYENRTPLEQCIVDAASLEDMRDGDYSRMDLAIVELENLRKKHPKRILALAKTGAELIAEERQRQIEQEGWSANHDDLHDRFQLSNAAMAYLNPSNSTHVRTFWPWDWKWWKPAQPKDFDEKYASYHIKDLVKAGALIAAEIDRLQRLSEKKEGA